MFINTGIKLVETGFQLAQADFPRPNSLKQIMSSSPCDRLLFCGCEYSYCYSILVMSRNEAMRPIGLLHMTIFHLVGQGGFIPIIEGKNTVHPSSVLSHC